MAVTFCLSPVGLTFCHSVFQFDSDALKQANKQENQTLDYKFIYLKRKLHSFCFLTSLICQLVKQG